MARIAIVLNSSWNIYNFRLSLLKRLTMLGHKIITIAPADEYTEKIPYEFHHLPIKSGATVSPVSDIYAFLTLLGVYKKAKPDIVLLFTIKPNIYGNFAAFLLGLKTISNISGLGTLFISQNFVTKIAKILYRIALKVPKKVFFQNHEDMGMFIDEGIVSRDVAERLPGSGVDIDRFAPKLGHERRIKRNKFVFLLFSRMLWDKGVGEYIEAAKLLLQKRNDVAFELLGFLDVQNPKAISARDMERFTETEGIKYLGVSDKVEDFILEADCIVLPSYREGVPRSLLEAAAMAKPIITSNIPGCRDVVEDGLNGFLCEPRNHRDLFEKMKKMLELGEDERRILGNNGREKMKREFDHNIVIAQYEKAIAELCSPK
jgi:glycosyltransferase involved in cell wall biosynthesis